jgi:hypothetical protein
VNPAQARAHFNAAIVLLLDSGDITLAGAQLLERVLDTEGITT